MQTTGTSTIDPATLSSTDAARLIREKQTLIGHISAAVGNGVLTPDEGADRARAARRAIEEILDSGQYLSFSIVLLHALHQDGFEKASERLTNGLDTHLRPGMTPEGFEQSYGRVSVTLSLTPTPQDLADPARLVRLLSEVARAYAPEYSRVRSAEVTLVLVSPFTGKRRSISGSGGGLAENERKRLWETVSAMVLEHFKASHDING